MSETLPRGERAAVDEPTLQDRLQTELDFTLNDTGEWITSNTLTTTSAGNYCEFLPTKTRLSIGGNRLEFGIHLDDLQKTLELERLKGKNAQDVDFMRSFWPEDSRYSMVEEDDYLYFGAPIEPTVASFEGNYSQIHDGIDLALQGAAENLSYEAMKQHKWFSIDIKQAERVEDRPGNGIMILSKREEDDEPYEVDMDAWEYQLWDREAQDLASYPLGIAYRQLQLMPNTFTFEGRAFNSGDGHMSQRRNHDGVESVSFYSSSHEKYANGRLTYILTMFIDNPAEFQTIADLAQTSRAVLRVREDAEPFTEEFEDKELLEKAVTVDVAVSEHGIQITGQDEAFELHIDEPCCKDCSKPLWKFRALTAKEFDEEDDVLAQPTVWQGSINTRQGYIAVGKIGHEQVDNMIFSAKDNFCPDDYYRIRDEFVAAHPTADRSTALAAVRERLASEGYDDVLIHEEQVWPRDDELQLLAYIEYERDGRTINRPLGLPRVSVIDPSQITLNLPDRSVIDFR